MKNVKIVMVDGRWKFEMGKVEIVGIRGAEPFVRDIKIPNGETFDDIHAAHAAIVEANPGMISGIAATGFPIIGEEDSEIGDDGQPATPVCCYWDAPFTLLCRISAIEEVKHV